MKVVAMAGLGLIVVSALAMAGCHHHPDEVVVEQGGPPPHEVVVEQPPPEAVVVAEPPPPVVVEAAPGPPPVVGMVWIGGYYTYRAHQYVWVHGWWGRPPYRGAHWEPHRWVREGGGYRYHAGGWHR